MGTGCCRGKNSSVSFPTNIRLAKSGAVSPACKYGPTKEHTEFVRDHYRTIYSKKPQREDEDNDSSYDEEYIKEQLATGTTAARFRKFRPFTVDPTTVTVEEAYIGPKLSTLDEKWAIEVMQYMEKGNRLHKRYVLELIQKADTILKTFPNVVDIQIPTNGTITICGDIHGQYYDLLNIFKINGYPSKTASYVFNGDFVDRGSFSIEVIITLIMWKCIYPDTVHLIRGNHENKQVHKWHGFKKETEVKYDKEVYKAFSRMFCSLPLAGLINKKVFVVHGGLAPEEFTLADVEKIDRFVDSPEKCLMANMLWSDVINYNGLKIGRGDSSVEFGPDIADKFLNANGLQYLIRSHEKKDEGYEIHPGGRLITVFSAPNYCDEDGNKGAFIKFEESPNLTPKFVQFTASVIPF